MNVIVWAGLTVLFVIVELVTYGLASIWFALGSLVALVVAALGGALWLQIVVFALVSIVTLLLTRPLAKKYVNSRTQATNADRVIGTRALVTEEINELAGTGSVRVDGKIWTARGVSDDSVIPVGTQVVVKEIRGVRLIVEPVR